MKVINSYFKDVEDRKDEIVVVYTQVLDYLKTRIQDKQLMEQIENNSKRSIVQFTDGNSYTMLAPDKTYKALKFRDSAAALKTNMAIRADEKEIDIIPGIALRPNYNKHQLVHELLHALSSTQHNYFDENGIAYTKTGTKIDYYDRDLNDYNMENNPSSDGLNEGITEFLTSMITDEYTGQYPGFVAVAGLLMSCNDQLLTAYFSSDTKALESFYNDLESKQTLITRDNLCKLVSNELDDDELIKIIVGALKYNAAYNNAVDISEVSGYLDNYYMLDSGSWMDLIKESAYKYEEMGTVSPMGR